VILDEGLSVVPMPDGGALPVLDMGLE